MDYCELRALKLARMQKVFTGGAPVYPMLLERLQRLAPDAAVVAVYGSTEAEPIAHVAWHEVSAEDKTAMSAGRGLLAGAPVPEIELRVLRHQWGRPVGPYTREVFERECVGSGKPGEIVVSGTHVLGGYLDRHGDAETKFEVNGSRWHRTGDAGYLDACGRLWLLGRANARIADGRGELYPFPVECAAVAALGARRAALVADEGQRVLAIEAAVPLDMKNLAQRLAWAQLDRVQIVGRIPVDRRHNAKVDYPGLMKILRRE